jgi:hypothetical protein
MLPGLVIPLTVFFCGSLIAWKTKKQIVVLIRVQRLSYELSLVTVEVTWLRWLFEDFDVSVSMPTPLLSDSTGAISIACDLVKHKLTKHIGVDAHFTRSQV